jgi:PhnB protein
MQVHPYLNFDGRCEEAIEFYKSAVAATIKFLTRFKDMPPEARPDGKPVPAEIQNRIMHAELTIGSSTVFVSDGRNQNQMKFEGISLSLSASTDAEAERLFTNLAEGGAIHMPLAKTFFSPKFGMLKDRFGIMWMVLVQP